MGITERIAESTDQSVAFLRNGYLFQDRLRQARGIAGGDQQPVDVKLLGRPALLVRGKEGVELFYDQDRIERHAAMPQAVAGTLFGKGAVHGLDGERHQDRKKMFLSITYDDQQVQRFMPLLEQELHRAVQQWTQRGGEVYQDTVLVYGRAILRWAGVPGDARELDPWARRLGQIVDGFGTDVPEHAQALVNRKRCDEWSADLVRRVRSGELTPAPETSLAIISNHREPDGQLLDEQTAGVELQNSTRPAIAVARFAAFAARALVEHPDYVERLRQEADERGTLLENPLAVAFAHEVRRVYPFVPMLPGVARKDFSFQGHDVHQGDRVLIDIRSTNLDPQEWDQAQRFWPERFLDVDAEQIPAFVPQGGSSVYSGHRCPGEKIAVTELSATISALASHGVRIDPAGLDYDETAMPTRPSSGGRLLPA